MRGWHFLMLCALILGQMPATGWRGLVQKPRCSVAVCQCRDCAGGANCCCAQAKTPLQQAAALFQCDRAEQQQLALTVMPRLAPAPLLIVPAPVFVFVPYFALDRQPIGRTLVPRSPPPR